MSQDDLSAIKEGILNRDINLNELIDEAKINYDSNGFFIARNLVNHSCYQACRKTAMEYFTSILDNSENTNLPYALRGDIPVGIKDFIGYSNNKNWHVYRYCHFLWNRGIEPLSILFQTSFALSQIRNIINGHSISYGSLVENNNYITYSSLSLYPCGGGRLSKHIDHQPTTKSPSLLHIKLELTHKGSDYSDGGFYFYDRNNRRVDVSTIVKPGDVIFFDGTQPHEILPINNGSLGRIAIFDIPTYVRETSRLNSYSGDGFSLPRKALTRLASLLP